MSADALSSRRFSVSYAATAHHDVLGAVHLFCVLPPLTSALSLPEGCLALVHRGRHGPAGSRTARNDSPGIAPSITTIIVRQCNDQSVSVPVSCADSAACTASDALAENGQTKEELEASWVDFCRRIERQKNPEMNLFAQTRQRNLSKHLTAKYRRLVEQRDVALMPPHVVACSIELSTSAGTANSSKGSGDTFTAVCLPVSHRTLGGVTVDEPQALPTEQLQEAPQAVEPVLAASPPQTIVQDHAVEVGSAGPSLAFINPSATIALEVDELLHAVAVQSDCSENEESKRFESEMLVAGEGSPPRYAAELAALREASLLLTAAIDAAALKPAAAIDAGSEAAAPPVPPAGEGFADHPTRDREELSEAYPEAAGEGAPQPPTGSKAEPSDMALARYKHRWSKWLIYLECVEEKAHGPLQTPALRNLDIGGGKPKSRATPRGRQPSSPSPARRGSSRGHSLADTRPTFQARRQGPQRWVSLSPVAAPATSNNSTMTWDASFL
jgi:hypothetical protein